MDAPRPSGKPLRFVTRATLFEALDGALEASLADGALTCGERQRARRRATQAFVVRLRTGSRRVRALSRAEFLAELEGAQARFAREKQRTERELVELEQGAAEAEPERVDILERRVAKLRGALEELEANYAELARRAAADPGLRSVYRELQGGATGERRRLLRAVLEENLALKRAREA